MMFDISLIVTRLQQETPYPVKLGYSANSSNKNLDAPPSLCVNYDMLHQKNELGELISKFPVNTTYAYGEIQDLIFRVEIECKVSDFPTVWDTVNAALVGWEAPNQDDSNSAIFPLPQYPKDISNGRMVWFATYRVEIPYQ